MTGIAGIRHRYGVPATVGGWIEYTDSTKRTRVGQIVAERAGLLRVRFNGDPHSIYGVHPTRGVVYLDKAPATDQQPVNG